jgi:putative ATP-dependent endonuclease of OLD family
MHLRALAVEGLGAVRSAELSLGAANVLIGENDAGIATILDALELALGSEALPARTARGRGDVDLAAGTRIRLTFEEREPGDWSERWHAPLRSALPRAGDERRRLVLEVEAGRGPRAPMRRVHIEGARGAPDGHAVVAHVLAMTPLVRVARGALARTRGAERRRVLQVLDATGAEATITKLVERVLFAAEDVLRGATTDVDVTVDEGARAAHELLGRLTQHATAARVGLAAAVLEILGGSGPSRSSPEPAAEPGAPLASRLGLLLAVAAVLRQLPRDLPEGAEPLLVLEQPEAHLHPMTLASAARVFERLRWQRIMTTNSSELLAATPLAEVRRVVRHDGLVRAASLGPRALSRADLRRLSYHLRVHRGVAMFARVWLLVEGESEFWILPQLAHVLGHDLAREGVACVTFAQSGLEPLLRAARGLALEWHLLADGDEAGRRYAAVARDFAGQGEAAERVTLLRERDVEHCFWHHGHAASILRAAGLDDRAHGLTPQRAIARAVERRSKPGLALGLVDAAARVGPESVPAPLARLIETCVALARAAPARAVAAAGAAHRRRTGRH